LKKSKNEAKMELRRNETINTSFLLSFKASRNTPKRGVFRIFFNQIGREKHQGLTNFKYSYMKEKGAMIFQIFEK
jgi:hypothetical protein